MWKIGKTPYSMKRFFLLSYFEYHQFLVKYTYGLPPVEQDWKIEEKKALYFLKNNRTKIKKGHGKVLYILHTFYQAQKEKKRIICKKKKLIQGECTC
jgi:hypothetical protein